MDNFTPKAQQVLQLARKEADRLKHKVINTEHILLGIAELGTGTATIALNNLGLDSDTLRKEIEELVGVGSNKVEGNISFTPRAKKTLALAASEARGLGHSYVGTEHLLLGLLRNQDDGEGIHERIFLNHNIDLDETRYEIMKLLDAGYDPDPAYERFRNRFITSPVPLRLMVDPGTAPPEVIADILSDMSILYRKSGGTGIEFRLQDVLVGEEAFA